jgi:hypothetical protein
MPVVEPPALPVDVGPDVLLPPAPTVALVVGPVPDPVAVPEAPTLDVVPVVAPPEPPPLEP